MRTVLHIGTPKTGTTALQTSLQASYDILLKSGVLYPDCGRGIRYNKHVLLLQPVMEFEKLPRSLRQGGATPADLEQQYRIFADAVRSQVDAKKPKCMVLSAENFSRNFPSAQLTRFSEELKGVGVREAQVAMYLRRPSSYFLSVAQQKLKASHDVKQPAVPRYRGVLERCADLFGAENVVARVFDRSTLIDGDIVADFCATFLAPEGVDARRLKPGPRTNETMSAESMDIVLRYRDTFERENNDMHTRDTRRLRALLSDAERDAGATRPRLREGIADMIDYSSPDILWMRDNHGIEFPGLDYTRLEKDGPKPIPDRTYTLDDLVEIDPEIRAKLLTRLERSGWAKKVRERREWISGLIREAA